MLDMITDTRRETEKLLMFSPPSPRHPKDRNTKETIGIIRQPCQTHIPRLKSRQQRKEPTSFDHRLVGLSSAVAVDVADAEE